MRMSSFGTAAAVAVSLLLGGCAGAEFRTVDPYVYEQPAPVYNSAIFTDDQEQDIPVYVVEDPGVPYWTLWSDTGWVTVTYVNGIWYDRFHREVHRGDWLHRTPPRGAPPRPNLPRHVNYERGLPNHMAPHPVANRVPVLRQNVAPQNPGRTASPNAAAPVHPPQPPAQPRSAQNAPPAQQFRPPPQQQRPAPQPQRQAPQQHQQNCDGPNQPRCK